MPSTYTYSEDILKNVTFKERAVLVLRSEISAADIHTICEHHEQELRKYTVRQKKCCDPYSYHKKGVTKSFRVISEDLYKHTVFYI